MLYELVVVTLTAVWPSTALEHKVEHYPNLRYEVCEQRKNTLYLDAVKTDKNIIIACKPQ